MKSLKRLSIDPLAVYGTLCVKCPLSDPSLADPACVCRVVEEIAIVSPKIIVDRWAPRRSPPSTDMDIRSRAS